MALGDSNSYQSIHDSGPTKLLCRLGYAALAIGSCYYVVSTFLHGVTSFQLNANMNMIPQIAAEA
ncbi:unnamed protein product, partial [marine sediment metagenome]